VNGKKAVNMSGFTRWKNTPAGATLDTGIGGFVIAKVLEKTGNKKAVAGFDKLRDYADWVDENVLAH